MMESSSGTRERPTKPRSLAEPIIRTNGLTMKFGNTVVVDNVTFHVNRGGIFGFIGPSGSGKTTTVRMLTGNYKPTSGEVYVYNTPPLMFSRRMREMIGYMPQLFVLYPNLTVIENLNFAASIYGMSMLRGKQLDQILRFVELSDHRNKLARNISGGMQRRLSLAATLVHDPDLVFLDEPTAGIDPVLRAKFWEHFRHLRDEGKTLFVTTQYVSEAAYCDIVAVMGDGRIISIGTPEELRKQAFGGEIIDMKTILPYDYRLEFNLSNLEFVRRRVVSTGERSLRLVVDEASTAIPAILDYCRANNLEVESIEEFVPPFDDVFVELVKGVRRSE